MEMYMRNANEIVKKTIGTEKSYCDGYFNGNNNHYIAGLTISIGTADAQLSHPGSKILDEINVFDIAETAENVGANIGQINLITVSSFCGPSGLLWGYEICSNQKRKKEISRYTHNGKEIPVYDADFLIDAFKCLVGTVSEPRFPILPGAIVPCANKKLIAEGEKHLYGCVGIGIPEDRAKNAILFMEDVGTIESEYTAAEKTRIMNLMAKAIFEIGKNNKVEYKELLISIKELKIEKGKIGCVLVAAPYIRLAQDAVPKDMELSEVDIDEWEKRVGMGMIK